MSNVLPVRSRRRKIPREQARGGGVGVRMSILQVKRITKNL
jgi:hypothetical protein